MRVALGLGGRMPVTPALPESWHATGNIRNLTVVDFKELVSDRGARIERAWYFGKGREIGEFGTDLFEIIDDARARRSVDKRKGPKDGD